MSGEALWSGLGLVAPLGARVSGAVPAQGVGGISIDTRTLAQDDLFVAIKGDNSDGHDHVRSAFEKGAAAAVIEKFRQRGGKLGGRQQGTLPGRQRSTRQVVGIGALGVRGVLTQAGESLTGPEHQAELG